MHYEIVDGYPMPAHFAGHPALELCNTWAGWHDVRPPGRGGADRGREYLRDFDRFAVWTGHVGLLGPADVDALRDRGRAEPEAARRQLRDTHRLRTALHDALLDGEGKAFETVASFADRAARASHLTRDAQGSTHRSVPSSTGLAYGLLVTTQSAEELLVDPLAETVKACPGDDCGWLFLDPRGRRRWCSMASCGNRAKVRAHAARRA